MLHWTDASDAPVGARRRLAQRSAIVRGAHRRQRGIAADTVRPVVDVATLAPSARTGTTTGAAGRRRSTSPRPTTSRSRSSSTRSTAAPPTSTFRSRRPVGERLASLISQQGNTTVRYRAVDSSGNFSLGVTANDDLEPAGGRGRDRRAADEHDRPQRRRPAGDRHGATQETATIASDPDAGARLARPNVTADGAAGDAHAAGAAGPATRLHTIAS